MGKIKKRKSRENGTLSYLVFVVPITIICVLLSFVIIQYLGERMGYSPVITLQSNCLGCTPGETVIAFVLVLSISIFVGLMFSYFLIKIVKRR